MESLGALHLQVPSYFARVYQETQEMEDVMIDVVVVQAIEPVEATITRTIYAEGSEEPTEETIENPLITQYNAERAEAQAVVDATPSAVVDAYNAL